MSDFSTTPKLELHLHLEGAAPPAFIRRLAQEKAMNVDRIFDEQGNYVYKDFLDFLDVYEVATSVLKTPEDYARLTREVLAQSAASGVIYTEAFLSPDFCGGSDLGAWREYMHAIEEAAAQAEAEHGIVMRGVVTAIRHFGPDKARGAALCAAETAGNWLVGFGMAGDEAKGKPRDFVYGFDMAREAGLGLTVHAGEWGTARTVEAAVRDLGVSRIGHGARAIEDPRVVDFLVEQGTTLEVCPGSNVQLGIYPDFAAHPIQALRERGVKVTVSTDDPTFFHITMASEYENLHKAFGWDEEAFAQLAATALEGAFCDAATKQTLAKRLETPQ